MLRTHLRRLSVASLALGVGFASASALAQDGGSAGDSSPSAFDGTALTLANGLSSGAISGSALAPTDANAPAALNATARRNGDADALADLLRGDNSLNLAVGRNVQDFAQHFAQQASDNGRRLGQTQFGGTTPTQTNTDTQGAVGGTALAQTAVNAPRSQGDNGPGLALGRDPGTFGLQAPDNGRQVSETQRAASGDSNSGRLGELRRSVDNATAEQVVRAKNALVAETFDDSKGKQGERRQSEEKSKNAPVAETIDDPKGKQLGERRQSEEKPKNALVAETIDDSKSKHLGDGRKSEEKPKNALVAETIGDSNGKHLGQRGGPGDSTIANHVVKAKNALVADTIGASNVHSAATFPGAGPVSLGDGPSGALAAAAIPIPEPANWLLLALGLIVLAGRTLMRRGTLLR